MKSSGPAHAAAVSDGMRAHWKDPDVRASRRAGVRERRIERKLEHAHQRGDDTAVAYWLRRLDYLKEIT